MNHPQRILAIINPRAGRWGSERSAAGLIRAACAAPGYTLTIRTVSGSQDARTWAEHAAREGYTRIIVCGGDGTVHEVVNGFRRGTSLPVVILPTGSGNVLAAELRIPSSLRAAVRCITDGQERTIDIGDVVSHNRCFMNAVTVGYGSKIIADTRRELKNLLGYPAYVLTALTNLVRIRSARFLCRIDSEVHTFDAQMVMVANIGLESLRLGKIGPTIAVDDGLMNIIVFSHTSVQDLAELIAGIVLPHRSTPHLQTFTARSVEISSDPILPVLIDGESCESGSVCISMQPRALTVIVPRATAPKKQTTPRVLPTSSTDHPQKTGE